MANNSSLTTKAHRLQKALNDRGQQILLANSEFYMRDLNRTCIMHSIKQAVWDEEKRRYTNIELFKTTSMVQVVLFLRDLWFELNGWELPDDNPIWEEAKRKNLDKRESSSGQYGRS